MDKKIGHGNKPPQETICGKPYTKRSAIQYRVALGNGYFAVLDKVTGKTDVDGVIKKLIAQVSAKSTVKSTVVKSKKAKVDNEPT